MAYVNINTQDHVINKIKVKQDVYDVRYITEAVQQLHSRVWQFQSQYNDMIKQAATKLELHIQLSGTKRETRILSEVSRIANRAKVIEKVLNEWVGGITEIIARIKTACNDYSNEIYDMGLLATGTVYHSGGGFATNEVTLARAKIITEKQVARALKRTTRYENVIRTSLNELNAKYTELVTGTINVRGKLYEMNESPKLINQMTGQGDGLDQLLSMIAKDINGTDIKFTKTLPENSLATPIINLPVKLEVPDYFQTQEQIYEYLNNLAQTRLRTPKNNDYYSRVAQLMTANSISQEDFKFRDINMLEKEVRDAIDARESFSMYSLLNQTTKMFYNLAGDEQIYLTALFQLIEKLRNALNLPPPEAEQQHLDQHYK